MPRLLTDSPRWRAHSGVQICPVSKFLGSGETHLAVDQRLTPFDDRSSREFMFIIWLPLSPLSQLHVKYTSAEDLKTGHLTNLQ